MNETRAPRSRQKIYAIGALAILGGLMLLGYFASEKSISGYPRGNTNPPPTSATTTYYSSGSYNDAADELGIDARSYERSADAHGVSPTEALAADLIICREIGECPTGMSQKEARDYICRRTGDC